MGPSVNVLSVGSAAARNPDLSAGDVNSMLDSASVYSSGARWHGVDISVVIPTTRGVGGQTIGGYSFPVFRPTTVYLRGDNMAVPYAFPPLRPVHDILGHIHHDRTGLGHEAALVPQRPRRL